MAGVPLGPLERLATTLTAGAAREVLARQSERDEARANLEGLVSSRASNLSAEESRSLRAALRSKELPPLSASTRPEFGAFVAASSAAVEAEEVMGESLRAELASARRALLEESRRILPNYLLFGAGGFGARITELLENFDDRADALSSRNARARERERHLLLYLQRVCAKNDTFSAFGPSAWGRVTIDTPLTISSAGAISRRDTFLERWTAHTLAAAMNADAEIRAELSPRLHPNCRVDGDQLIFTETGESAPAGSDTVALLKRCDGKTPAHSLGVSPEILEHLAEEKILRWEIEVPALEPHAFNVLLSQIRQWRDNPVRARWLDAVEDIARLPLDFAQAAETPARVTIMEEARQRLQELGGARDSAQRFLYAATNPIAEECFREGTFEIPEAMTADLAREAAPWFDLWRDTYAFVASRVAAGLRGLFQTAPLQNGAVPLPAFLKHCEQQKMSLTGPGIVALAHIAFQEVKAAFRKEVGERAGQAEVILSEHDCHFVRRNFAYEKFDDYTYPSADLQISALSVAEAAAGNYDWIVSELHPPVALLHHCFYWSCPDRAQLGQALASTTFGRPAFHYGFFAADFTAHTAVRVFDALPELTNFVAPQRPDATWRQVPPAETEVYVDGESGDVRLRRASTGESLGSFARAWLIPLGFHPFSFGGLPHLPRLRCGRVIVQRRSWIVRREEFTVGNYTGVSRDLVLAVTRLRLEKDWPRHIYIRPSEQALRRSGAVGRDKDTKPVYIDLESYLFLEIFYRWLTKAGELEVTEMLPDPEHLLWQEKDGRRTFELRTQIVPAE